VTVIGEVASQAAAGEGFAPWLELVAVGA
jgi:hypothetical protein